MQTRRSNTVQEIVNDIANKINKSPYYKSSWYVGITQDIEQRLFGAHNVSRESVYWIYRPANSSHDARQAEQALISWGCDGGTGGGDSNATYVYAYYKASYTRR